jgi:mediator of RNA polymerase II transcription subunit 12, fungi type
LNTIDVITNITTFAFLPTPTPSATGSFDWRPFGRRLSILLSWATNADQAGDLSTRPYAAGSLIQIWKGRSVSSVPNVSQTLQRHLLNWLEEQGFIRPKNLNELSGSYPIIHRPSVQKPEEIEATAVLFGDLVKRRLFSFSDYLTRMSFVGDSSSTKTDSGSSASPETPSLRPAVNMSKHLEIIRSIPFWDKVSEQILNQRRIALYGIRARKTYEDAMEKEIRAEIRRVVPLFFNGMYTA